MGTHDCIRPYFKMEAGLQRRRKILIILVKVRFPAESISGRVAKPLIYQLTSDPGRKKTT